MRDQRGQASAESMGLVALAAAVLFLLISSGLPGQIAGNVSDALCRMVGTGCPPPAAQVQDLDGDGLTAAEEEALGTSPNAADTDADGLDDRRERDLGEGNRTHGAAPDPTKADGDEDGLNDQEELNAGTLPGAADGDTDGNGGLSDGLDDREELALGTDPHAIDTDGDGEGDGDEVAAGTDPLRDERSGVDKAATAVGDFILDDPTNLSPKGIVKGGGDLISGAVKAGGKRRVKKPQRTAPRARPESPRSVQKRKRRAREAERHPGGRVVGRYRGNRGPLDAQDAASFAGGRYVAVRTTEPITLYRVYDGTHSRPTGGYWTRERPGPDVEERLALPPGNGANRLVRMELPPGHVVYEGRVAPNFGRRGGGTQVLIRDFRIPEEWVTPLD